MYSWVQIWSLHGCQITPKGWAGDFGLPSMKNMPSIPVSHLDEAPPVLHLGHLLGHPVRHLGDSGGQQQLRQQHHVLNEGKICTMRAL
jgi:hypothetical protein